MINTILKKLLLSVFLGASLLLGTATFAHAGTDLNVNCPAIGTCSISPSGTPLYNEAGWVPGSTVTQRLRMTNTSSQTGFAGIQVTDYTELKNLGEVIDIQIHRGSPVGPTIYSAANLHVFRDDGYFTIDTITAGQTTDYYFIATMTPAAGNQYQASQVQFDLRTGLEVTPIAPPSGGNSGGGGGSVLGTATAPTCTANPPSSAPVVTITNVGTNTVSLSWTAVSPVTHYGLFFTRTSDGAEYGASNIGNVTTYTITNLSGGANYSFQVFGVNDCAPGPRSGNATSGTVPGGFIAGRPIGGGGQVLGVTTESPSPTPSPSAEPTPTPAAGAVQGTTTEICTDWRRYIPWILLVVQFLFILFFEYRLRYDNRNTKHVLAILATAVSIILFYLLRQCDCYGEWSWLAWLCRWYWLVAILLTVLLKGFSYAFLDESSEREKPAKTEKLEKAEKTEKTPAVEKVEKVEKVSETPSAKQKE